MPEPEPLKSTIVQARLTEALKRKVEDAVKKYGVTEAGLVRDGLEAIRDYIDRGKGYRRPIAVVHDNREEHERQVAAEPTTTYGEKTGNARPILPAEVAARNELARRGKKASPVTHK